MQFALLVSFILVISIVLLTILRDKNDNNTVGVVAPQSNEECVADASWVVARYSVKDLVSDSVAIIGGTIERPSTPNDDVRYSSIRVREQLKGKYFDRNEVFDLCIPLRTSGNEPQDVIAFLIGVDDKHRWVTVDGWNGVVYEKEGLYDVDNLIQGQQQPHSFKDIKRTILSE